MKKLFLILAATTLALTACEEPYAEEVTEPASTASDGSAVVKTKKFTFTMKGDFSTDWKSIGTRGYLSADGKDMTDVWVLDYDGSGNLLQQLHQTSEDEDFGTPTMNLAYGQHHIYFITSRGQNPTLDTENHLIKFTKVLDTFYKDYEVSVVATSNGNRAVTLDRVVTKLKLVFSDAIPTNAATFNVTPGTWYYGFNYQAGEPTAAATSQTVTLNIPSSSIGKTGEFLNIFGFSTAAQWTTDVSLNAKTSADVVLGSATLSAVPFKANRVSEFTGPLFGSEGNMTLSLNSTWDDAYNGTW